MTSNPCQILTRNLKTLKKIAKHDKKCMIKNINSKRLGKIFHPLYSIVCYSRKTLKKVSSLASWLTRSFLPYIISAAISTKIHLNELLLFLSNSKAPSRSINCSIVFFPGHLNWVHYPIFGTRKKHSWMHKNSVVIHATFLWICGVAKQTAGRCCERGSLGQNRSFYFEFISHF